MALVKVGSSNFFCPDGGPFRVGPCSMPKTNQRNYYRVLYVQPDAPTEVIQASYRTIMQKLKAHPDLGGDEWIASVINEAFEVLRDPVKRRAYDEELFKHSDMKELSLQHKGQRRQKADYSIDAAWEEFRPSVL